MTTIPYIQDKLFIMRAYFGAQKTYLNYNYLQI